MNTRINTIAAKKLFWLAVGLVLLVNAFILGKVYLNRSEVIAQLQLSERELQFPHNYGFSKEDSSARVSLHWTAPSTEPINVNMNQWSWLYHRQLQLNDAHFLGFQFPDCTQKTRLRQKRSAWVLLEFNGKSYTEYVAQVEQYHALIMSLTPAQNTELSEKELAEKRKNATEFLTEAKTASSRLFVIDAAADRGLLEIALRNRQTTDSSQLFIVPAELRAGYYRCDKSEKRTTEVIIDNLAVESLYIPKQFSQHFPKDRNEKRKAKFTLEISYGRFFEPWVSGFTSTTEKKHVMP
jgi:Domain of unknown function (DUF4824)